MTMWCNSRNIRRKEKETEGMLIKIQEKKRTGAKRLVGDMTRHELSREVMLYMGSLLFLSSSVLWCAVHSMELMEKKDGFVKKVLTLIAIGAMICAYIVGITQAIIIQSQNRCEKDRYKDCRDESRIRMLEKIGTASYFLEALTCVFLACISMKYISTGTQAPGFFPALGCLGSAFSIVSSVTFLCKIRSMTSDAKQGELKISTALRMLSILLSTTNICLCIASLSPAINEFERLKTAIALSVSVGWVIAFSGAIMLTRSSQLQRARLQQHSADVSTAIQYEYNNDICMQIDPSSSHSLGM